MAGAGYRQFTPGQILTAEQVQTYLQDQSVLVFNNSAARSSALGTFVSEGMLTYLKDTDALEVYDGANWDNVNDNTNSIAKNTFTAAGQIIYSSGSATPVALAAGTSGQYLKSDGTAVSWAALAAATKTVVVFTSSTTWVVPSGVNYINIYAASGGGGGASGGVYAVPGSTTIRYVTGGGGGAGNGVYLSTDFPVTPGSTATITIGAGGAGGTSVSRVSSGSAVGTDGSSGGVSSFVIDGDTFTTSSIYYTRGLGGNITSTTNAAATMFWNAQIDVAARLYNPLYIVGGDGGVGDDTDGLTGNSVNLSRKLFSVAKKLGDVSGEASGTNFGTAGTVANSGFVGGGGGGAGSRYSTTIGTFVYAGGTGIGGGGAGGASAHTISAGVAGAGGAGGNAAANSGAGGGGGGGCTSNSGTAISGAGGNGGSGFIIVTY